VARRLGWLLLIVVLALGSSGIAAWFYFSPWESTDDAQVDGHINPVNAKVAGTVMTVHVTDNQFVEAGTVLVEIDPRDYEIAVARARAELANAEAEARASRAQVPLASSSSGLQISTAQAGEERAKGGVEAAAKDVAAAQARGRLAEARVREVQANATRAQRDLERMQMLIEKEEVSRQQYDAAVANADAARASVESAQAAVIQVQSEVAAAEGRLVQARAALMEARAQVTGAKTAPDEVRVTEAKAASADARIQLAKTQLDQALLDLDHTTVRAPVSGAVSKKAVEAGQVAQRGQPLMAIIPREDVWITANFKETQLASMKPGQEANVSVDAYNGRVFKGRVDSIASATGARFSLLPPENATGNYVKVVQRIPVKVVLEPGQDRERQLRPGMSVVVKVKTKN
jgi:membrane fusion protein (multidrug efflux system)